MAILQDSLDQPVPECQTVQSNHYHQQTNTQLFTAPPPVVFTRATRSIARSLPWQRHSSFWRQTALQYSNNTTPSTGVLSTESVGKICDFFDKRHRLPRKRMRWPMAVGKGRRQGWSRGRTSSGASQVSERTVRQFQWPCTMFIGGTRGD